MTDEYQEVPAISAGKRLGVQWCPWMGDWFTSWSPRNSNSNGEGEWDQWVDLAIKVLQSPLTKLTRPDAHAAAADLPTEDYYTGSARELTDEELRTHLRYGNGRAEE